MSNDTLILVVGTFVSAMAIWGLVLYFIVLFRERYAQVDPNATEIVATSDPAS